MMESAADVICNDATEGHVAIAIGIDLLGATVAVAAGMAALLKFQEQWLKYRTTAESLKKEKSYGQKTETPEKAGSWAALGSGS
jgi:hypothetical protein